MAEARASLSDALAQPKTLVTRGTSLNAAVLLQQARERAPGITLEELTAARLIASERSRGTPEEWACIVDAELNRANRKGKSLTEHLTAGTGIYGPQGRKRPAATRRNPTFQHLQAARAVLSGDARGISRGATRFFDPRAQNRLHRSFKAGGTPGRVFSCSALGTLRAWSFDLPRCKDGRRCCSDGRPPKGAKPGPSPEAWVGPIPGVDAYRLMLFKRMPLGDEHSAQHERAAQLIKSRQGPLELLDSPEGQLVALLALGVAL